MGRNVKKCTIYLYNIPEGTPIPEFTSTAWAYDSQGPVRGSISVVTMYRDSANNLICYDVPKTLLDSVPPHIRATLTTRRYLGVPRDAQLNCSTGKQKIINKLQQRIGLVANKSHSIQEAIIAHNMLVCQVATFSPLCITFSLQECATIDKQLLKSYQYQLQLTSHDAKHSIFLSKKKGGYGLHSFTRE